MLNKILRNLKIRTLNGRCFKVSLRISPERLDLDWFQNLSNFCHLQVFPSHNSLLITDEGTARSVAAWRHNEEGSSWSWRLSRPGSCQWPLALPGPLGRNGNGLAKNVCFFKHLIVPEPYISTRGLLSQLKRYQRGQTRFLFKTDISSSADTTSPLIFNNILYFMNNLHKDLIDL